MHSVTRGRRARLVRSVPRFALGLVAGIANVASPATVSAHAELDTITPKDKATVTGSPTQIVATFTQHLDPAASNLKVKDAAGTVVAQGGEVGADELTLTLAIASPLAPGAYTVEWTSKSADDGELDRGKTTFKVVAAPSAPPSPSAEASLATSPSPALSQAPSVAPATPTPSAAPAPAASTTDMLFPIAAALVVLAVIGAWLLRGRGRARG
jgi:methionine-rich copper-binding protein CopC